MRSSRAERVQAPYWSSAPRNTRGTSYDGPSAHPLSDPEGHREIRPRLSALRRAEARGRNRCQDPARDRAGLRATALSSHVDVRFPTLDALKACAASDSGKEALAHAASI